MWLAFFWDGVSNSAVFWRFFRGASTGVVTSRRAGGREGRLRVGSEWDIVAVTTAAFIGCPESLGESADAVDGRRVSKRCEAPSSGIDSAEDKPMAF